MASNMYRVGDYVYFETSSTSPYQIRRIEELIKTPGGNVDAKVMCFFRRRDIPSHLLAVATLKHHSALEDDADMDDGDPSPPHHTTHHLQQSPHTRLLGPSSQSSRNANNISSSLLNNNNLNSSSINTTCITSSLINTTTPKDNNDRLSSTPSPVTITEERLSITPNNTHSITSNSGVVSKAIPNNVCRPPSPCYSLSDERSSLSEDQRHQLRHRELFLTRQIETLPATHIRGKCAVTLLNETETLASYMAKEDTFFYSLVYDPQAKTLLADKGEIRIGSKYQAEVTDLLKQGESDGRSMSELEDLVWLPSQRGLSDKQIDQFLVVARSVGTFARALDCSSSVKQPSLHMSAAAASRDITLFEAMSLLHQHQYSLSCAVACLVPGSGPLLCRDQMEEWAASEANLFEEALDKYGKDFNDIRQDFLPWKTLKNIIEYYYMWKTTDRYVQQKRVKAVEAEARLKQVYIPSYNKPNPAAITSCAGGKPMGLVNGNGAPAPAPVPAPSSSCEGCSAGSSNQWYNWGPAQKQCRLCDECWGYWRKLGGLKKASRSAKEEDGGNGAYPVVISDTPLVATHQHLLKRRPHQETNGTEGGPPSKRPRDSSDPPLDTYRLSQLGVNPPPGLTVTPIGMNGGTSTPPPPPPSSTTTTRLPGATTATPPPPPYHSTHHNTTPNSVACSNITSLDGARGAVIAATGGMSHLQHAGGGRAKMATVSRLSGRPRIISWMDAPDDVYFYSTTAIKNHRRTLTLLELKRAARRPWRRLLQLPQAVQQHVANATQLAATSSATLLSVTPQSLITAASGVTANAAVAAAALAAAAAASVATPMTAQHLTAID